MREEKGITLVALVVTIIVLLILAGVTITLALSQNGIIERARNAGDAWNQGVQNEENVMTNFTEYVNDVYDKYVSGFSSN